MDQLMSDATVQRPATFAAACRLAACRPEFAHLNFKDAKALLAAMLAPEVIFDYRLPFHDHPELGDYWIHYRGWVTMSRRGARTYHYSQEHEPMTSDPRRN
jgi:hypothetical protein